MSGTTTLHRKKLIPIVRLISVLRPQFGQEEAVKVKDLYTKLAKNEIPRQEFIRSLRSIAGADSIKMAVYEIESRDVRADQSTLNAPEQQENTSGVSVPELGQKPASGRKLVSDLVRVGQKRPLDDLFSSPTPSSKKQKVPAADMISAVLPLLDNERAMKVKASFMKFTKKEIHRRDFVESMCSIVGGHTIKTVVQKLFTRQKRDNRSVKDLITAFKRDVPVMAKSSTLIRDFVKIPAHAAVIMID